MALTVRITTHDAQGNEQVNEMQLEPGAQVPVSEGDRVEIIDSEGWPIGIVADGDDVVVTILPETQLAVIIDGVTYGVGQHAATFENLARHIEDEEVESSISFMDPVTEELTVVTSIEDLLAGKNTATGDEVPGQSGFSPGIELEPNDPLDSSDIFADARLGPKWRRREMWHDENSPDLGSNERNVISAWVVVASFFFSLMAFSAIHGIIA